MSNLQQKWFRYCGNIKDRLHISGKLLFEMLQHWFSELYVHKWPLKRFSRWVHNKEFVHTKCLTNSMWTHICSHTVVNTYHCLLLKATIGSSFLVNYLLNYSFSKKEWLYWLQAVGVFVWVFQRNTFCSYPVRLLRNEPKGMISKICSQFYLHCFIISELICKI